MTTRAVLSLDHGRDYCFTAPIAALFWRELIGHEPLVLLAEDLGYWLAQPVRCRIALEAMHELKLDTHFVGHVEGYETGRIGQNAREHAAVLDLPEDDFLLMSDADLVPLKRDFYQRHIANGKIATCYYGNGDHFKNKQDVLALAGKGRPFQTIPTCHVTMRVKHWRECYEYAAGEPLALVIKRSMDRWMGSLSPDVDRNFELWMQDQRLVTERLCRRPWFPDQVEMIERRGHPPVDRICRSNAESWSQPLDGRWVDAHVHKAPDRDKNWPHLRRIIAHYLAAHLSWADSYREQFAGSYVD